MPVTYHNAAIIDSSLGTIINVAGALALDEGGNYSIVGIAPGYVPTSRTISTNAPLTGGGDLTSNRTLSIPAATALADGYMTSAQAAAVAALGSASTHAAADFDAAGAAAAVLGTSLQKASNLSDLANVATARINLGLGSAAVAATSDFDAAGAAAAVLGTSLQKSSNLSDLNNVATARINLGLGNVDNTADSAKSVLYAATAGSAATATSATTATTAGYATTAGSATPTAHAASHASTGSDPVTLAQSQVTNLASDLAAKVPLSAYTAANKYLYSTAASTVTDATIVSAMRDWLASTKAVWDQTYGGLEITDAQTGGAVTQIPHIRIKNTSAYNAGAGQFSFAGLMLEAKPAAGSNVLAEMFADGGFFVTNGGLFFRSTNDHPFVFAKYAGGGNTPWIAMGPNGVALNGGVTSGKTNMPDTLLHVGQHVGSATYYATTAQILSSTAMSTTAESLLKLVRAYSNGVYYPGAAEFTLRAYGTGGAGVGYVPTTELGINLKAAGSWSEQCNVTALTLRDNGVASLPLSTSQLGIGLAPTAHLTLRAGAAAAGSAPIKLTAGPLLTAPEAGAVEHLSDQLFFTIPTGTARKRIALCDSSLTSGLPVYGTTDGRLTSTVPAAALVESMVPAMLLMGG